MFMRGIKGCLIGPIRAAVAAVFFLMPEKLLMIPYSLFPDKTMNLGIKF